MGEIVLTLVCIFENQFVAQVTEHSGPQNLEIPTPVGSCQFDQIFRDIRSCRVLCEFLLLIFYALHKFELFYFITCMCIYKYKMCEKFGGCKKSLSWLGQKVNKKISEACGHNADDSSLDLCPRPGDDLNTVQYSNRI